MLKITQPAKLIQYNFGGTPTLERALRQQLQILRLILSPRFQTHENIIRRMCFQHTYLCVCGEKK